MEKFLGVLFCGGKGERLGLISEYVSKSLLPVYDMPCFMFGLNLLKRSRLIDSVILLTNRENDKALRKTGLPTIVQDNDIVNDMFTGWEYIKRKTGTKLNGVLMPSDNISNVDADRLIRTFCAGNRDFVFSIKKAIPEEKLRQMGNFDPVNRRYSYKPRKPLEYGVIAPYVIRNSFSASDERKVFEGAGSEFVFYKGPWRDIGDADSFARAVAWRRNRIR